MRSHWYGNDFYSHANETQFHMNWKVLHLASFKVRVFGTRKWPIKTQANFRRICMESTEHKHHLNLSTNLHHPLIFRQVGIFHFLSDHPTQFNNFINLVFVTSSLLCSLPAIWCSSLSFFFRRLLSLLLFRQRSRIPEKKKKRMPYRRLRSSLQDTCFMAEPNLMIYSEVLIVSGSVKLVHGTTVRV